MDYPQPLDLRPGIYLTDNGAAYCREHLGTSARYTGRDISGQPIMLITAEMLDAEGVPPIPCEVCGATTYTWADAEALLERLRAADAA